MKPKSVSGLQFLFAFALFVAVIGGASAFGAYEDGTDYMSSSIGALDITINGSGPLASLGGDYTTSPLSGHTLVWRENVYPGPGPEPDANGDNDLLMDIPTGFLEFEHSGTINISGSDLPLRLLQSLTRETLGVVEQTSGADFPAESFFDVFFEIEVDTPSMGTLTLYNTTALRMIQRELDGFPPSPDIVYESNQAPLGWWPENEADTDVGYPFAPDLGDWPLPLYMDGVSGPVGELTGHPIHDIVPEPATLIIWSLLGTLGIAYGWRRRRAA